MKNLLALLVLFAACTDDDDAGRTAEFVGIWAHNGTSMVITNCDDDRLDRTTASTGSFQFAAGTMSDLIQVPDTDRCSPTRYDVEGSVATVVLGQTCMFSETAMGVTINYNITSLAGSVTLSSDGTVMTGTETATVLVTGGVTTTCAANATVAATKVGS